MCECQSPNHYHHHHQPLLLYPDRCDAGGGEECQNIPVKGRFRDQMLCGGDGGIRGGVIGSALWPVKRGRAKLHLIPGGGGEEDGGLTAVDVIRHVRTCSGGVVVGVEG